MSERNCELYPDAQHIEETEYVGITENIVIEDHNGDRHVIIGTDPLTPMDPADFPADVDATEVTIVDREFVPY